MWIARDANGELFLYKHKPVKDEEGWLPNGGDDDEYMNVEWDEWFPEVRWSDEEPTELIIKKGE